MPTCHLLQPGDCVFVEIGTYRFLRAPTRGEIVSLLSIPHVFLPSAPHTARVKLNDHQNFCPGIQTIPITEGSKTR
jgi:hypothetical protein